MRSVKPILLVAIFLIPLLVWLNDGSSASVIEVKALNSSDISPTTHTEFTAAIDNTVPVTKPSTQNQQATEEAATSLPHERIAQKLNLSDFQLALVSEQETFHRYPPQITPLTQEAANPISQRYAVDERTTQSEDKQTAMTIWSDQKYYSSADKVTVYAKIENQEGAAVNTQFEAELIKGNQTLHQFRFTSDAAGQTASHEFMLGEYLADNAAGIYKILVNSPQFNIRDAVAFTLSEPGIELTGKFEDSVTDDGHLNIAMEVNIAVGQRYYAQASLFDLGGSPIAATQFSGELKAGLQWIDLTFPGLLLHDHQEDGPYVLQQVSLAKVAMPLERAPLQTPNYETQAYRLESFSKSTYQETKQ